MNNDDDSISSVVYQRDPRRKYKVEIEKLQNWTLAGWKMNFLGALHAVCDKWKDSITAEMAARDSLLAEVAERGEREHWSKFKDLSDESLGTLLEYVAEAWGETLGRYNVLKEKFMYPPEKKEEE